MFRYRQLVITLCIRGHFHDSHRIYTSFPRSAERLEVREILCVRFTFSADEQIVFLLHFAEADSISLYFAIQRQRFVQTVLAVFDSHREPLNKPVFFVEYLQCVRIVIQIRQYFDFQDTAVVRLPALSADLHAVFIKHNKFVNFICDQAE